MTKRTLLSSLFAGGLVGQAGVASAQDMIAIDFERRIYSIDSSTGGTFFLDQSPSLYATNAMAKDSAGRIYVSSSPQTVGWSKIALLDVERAALMPIVEVPPLERIVALAFGANDVLYVIEGGDTNDDRLYAIDLATGTVQLVASTGLNGIQSLAYWNGMFYAYDNFDNPGIGAGLVTIDPLTGAVTDVNPNLSSTGADVQTLCFDWQGILYGGGFDLAIFNTTTGKATFLFDLSIWARGMEFLEPIPYALRLVVTGDCPGAMAAAVSGASPRDVIAFLYSLGSSGPFAIPPGQPCAGTLVELGNNVMLGGLSNAGEFGNARFVDFRVPSAVCGLLRFQALNLTTCETSNVVRVE